MNTMSDDNIRIRNNYRMILTCQNGVICVRESYLKVLSMHEELFK